MPPNDVVSLKSNFIIASEPVSQAIEVYSFFELN